MKNAILVPGRPDKNQHYDPSLPSNSEGYWFSWLKRQLILNDIQANAIEPPMPFRPRYEEWKKEFERFDITNETVLVGHSCGGGFLVRYLSEHKDLKVGKVYLVAPWINPDDNALSETADFFHFKIDPNFARRAASVTVFVSSDDYPDVVKTVDILAEKVPDLDIHHYNDRGHFKEKLFPELLDLIIS
ncbi:MAG: hypothetical protein JWO35_852 [Candidatus Saccharibacteria bacterium]|nr:hypothetical protein [Candidatus Saccharibacteria bacterium]